MTRGNPALGAAFLAYCAASFVYLFFIKDKVEPHAGAILNSVLMTAFLVVAFKIAGRSRAWNSRSLGTGKRR